MTWWGWMIIGAVLLGAELMVIDAQFYLVFLGISAAIVGALALVGVALPEWAQWITFAVLSLLSFFTFRQRMYERISGGAPGFHDTVVGETIKLAADLAPGDEMRAQFRGSDWTLRNVGQTPIAAGDRAVIVKSQSLTLHVSAQ